MDTSKLELANNLKNEIDKLDKFIKHSKRTHYKIIKKEISIIGIAPVLGREEIKISDNLNDRIVDLLQTYKNELKDKFNNL